MKIYAHPAAIAALGQCKLNSRPLLIDLVIDAFAVQVLKQGQENFTGIYHCEALEDELHAVSSAQDGQKFAGTRVLALPGVWLHLSDFVRFTHANVLHWPWTRRIQLSNLLSCLNHERLRIRDSNTVCEPSMSGTILSRWAIVWILIEHRH